MRRTNVGGVVRSIVLLPLVARCLELIDLFYRKNFYLQKNSTKSIYNYVKYLQPAILKYMSLD